MGSEVTDRVALSPPQSKAGIVSLSGRSSLRIDLRSRGPAIIRAFSPSGRLVWDRQLSSPVTTLTLPATAHSLIVQLRSHSGSLLWQRVLPPAF